MTAGLTHPAVLGVYSLRITNELGSGATTADHKNVTYWYIRQLDEASFERQPLAVSGLPSGMRDIIPVATFIRDYTPEPFHYNEHPVQELESLADKILDREDPAALSALGKAERAALGAILVEPEAFPEARQPDFEQKALSVLGKAGRILKTLLLRSETARFENRERFSVFGVKLRKDGHFDESISYFSKALALEKNDENIHFNMARVYYDMGDMAGCRKALEQALTINPEFPEAGQFARFVARKAFRPA